MFEIALYQPEIPPNTGNIIRLCANFGVALHIIQPAGFELDDRRLRRAGLDYHEFATIQLHADFDAFTAATQSKRLIGFTTKARSPLHRFNFQPNDILLFGPETRGLPKDILESLPASQLIRIAMQDNSRSLNLSNAVAIATFEASRQLELSGLQ
ncbi:MAG: tRNA (cytidine(34)-2'-O)-methyltransferase [Gammaproteobacteria bacterium]|nr:tRNA (cytidine(34)-2'-O)-methyltransferase [Gammaproteobacteria bacterium]